MQTRTLAQLDRLFADIPPLPEPPLLERLLFESPFLLAAGLFVAGLVAVFSFRNAGKGRAGVIALGVCVLLCVGVFLSATLVTTDRETLLEKQDALVSSVATADTDALDRLLSPDARMPSVNLSLLSGGLKRQQILTTIAATTGGAYPVEDYAILERQAVIDGANSARTQIHVRVESSAGGPTLTWFRIGWRLDHDRGWEAVEIEPIFISGVLPYKG